MKKSSAPNETQSALNAPQEAAAAKTFLSAASNNRQSSAQRPIKQESQFSVSHQEWPSTYDNSNASWDSNTSWPSSSNNNNSQFPKHPAFGGNSYKPKTPAPYQSPSSSDWSTGESSTSNPVPSNYAAGMQTTQQPATNSLSASPSPAYYPQENNSSNFYGGGYGGYDSNFGGGGYVPPPYRSSQQPMVPPQYQQKGGGDAGSYNGNRNPSSCPPAMAKHPIPDYNQRNPRYGMEPGYKVQIKREPEEYVEGEGDNFTSLFTRSLTSLYSEDPDNAYREDGSDPDIIICTPPPATAPMPQPGNYQRLMPPGNPYPPNYPHPRNSGYPVYDGRHQNTEAPPPNVGFGPENERMNPYRRYDRPSFDDMHLFTPPHSNKKRKHSMPNLPPEANPGTEARRKGPRMTPFKSDSQWTPNSFAFGNVQIKQEPLDDYPQESNIRHNASNSPPKDIMCSNGRRSKSPSQQQDHPKPAPRKRSPAAAPATCFERFEKKSTPLNKKVSPLSVYAKVQDGVVMSVKCRRYKKRTKPIVAKEEVTYPTKEDVENWKKSGVYNQSPDQAVHILMGDLVNRVCQSDSRHHKAVPDLTKLDTYKLQELVYQMCQRYSLDFREYDDVQNILNIRLVKDKVAKNSERASAIRKRISLSPAQNLSEGKIVKVEKMRKRRSVKPAPTRSLRNLPGRDSNIEELELIEIGPARRKSRKTPGADRRFSVKSVKDDEEKASEVETVIEESADRESEASKEAEVRKKSERLKQKPVTETLAKDQEESDKTENQDECKKERVSRSKEKSKVKNKTKEKSNERDESKEKSKERETSTDKSKERQKSKEKPSNPASRWSRGNGNCRSVLRSASIEIVELSESDSCSLTDDSKKVNEVETNKSNPRKSTKRTRSSTKSSSRERSRKNSIEAPVDKSKALQSDKKSDSKNNKVSQKESSSKTTKKESKEDTISKIIEEVSKNKTEPQEKRENCRKPSVATRSPSTRKRKSKVPFDFDDFLDKCDAHYSKIEKKSDNSTASNKKLDNSQKSSTSDKSKRKSTPTKNKKQDSHKSIAEENATKQEESTVTEKIDSALSSTADIKRRKSRSHSRSTKDESSPNSAAPKNKFIDNSKSCTDSEVSEKKAEATEEEKLSTLPQNKSTRSKGQTIEKASCQSEKKSDSSSESVSVLPAARGSREEVSSSNDTRKINSFSFPIKKRDKSVQIAVNRPLVFKPEECKASKSSSQLPPKKNKPRRASNQSDSESKRASQSDSEPQVILTKLPEVSSMNSIPVEYFDRFVSREKNRLSTSEEPKCNKNSDDNSSVGSPPVLVCMKDPEADGKMSDLESLSKGSFDSKDDSAPMPLIHYDTPIPPSEVVPVKKRPLPIRDLRYSADSEDSEGGLVIDLDRRMSVEEDSAVPAPVITKSLSREETSEPVTSKDAEEESPKVLTFEKAVAEDLPCSQSPDVPKSNADPAKVEVVAAEAPLIKAEEIKTEVAVAKPEEGAEAVKLDSNSSEARYESILRSLLVDKSNEGSTGSSQSATLVSKDYKFEICKEVNRFLKSLEKLEPHTFEPVANSAHVLSLEVKSAYQNLILALDRLHSSNFVPNEGEEWLVSSKIFKDSLDKLKMEIDHLQCVAYQKEKQRRSMIYLKNCMEKLVQVYLENYSPNKLKEEKDNNGEASCSYEANTSTDVPANTVPGHLLQMAQISLNVAKYSIHTAMLASQKTPNASQAAEQLPTVETMVANASDNYGVDMRIVKTGSPAPAKPSTILEKALSSKEPVLSQSALEKVPEEKSPQEQPAVPHLIPKATESSPKRIPSSQDSPLRPFRSNPSPELRVPATVVEKPLHQTILHQALSKDSSPSHQPTLSSKTSSSKIHPTSSFPSTSYQEDTPLDFSVDVKSAPPTKTSTPYPPSQKEPHIKPKNRKSSPKHISATSYSVWKKTQAVARTSSPSPAASMVDLRMDPHAKAVHETTRTASPKPPSTSQSVIMRPTHHKGLSPKHVPFQQKQRPESVNHLIVSTNHQHSSEGRLPPPTASSGGEPLLRKSTDQIYHHKLKEDHRSLSYSSLASSDSMRLLPPGSSPRMSNPGEGPYPCNGCGAPGAKFLCSGCREHWYCSPQCQNLQWPEHRRVCPGFMYSNNGGPSHTKNPTSIDH